MTSNRKRPLRPNAAAATPSNRLLNALAPAEYKRLAPHLEMLHFELKHVAFEANQPIEYAYFPISGIVSMVTVMKGGKAVEVATVGNEGMVGLPLFLGVNITPSRAFVQVPGDGIRIAADVFQKEVRKQGALAKILQTYTQALIVQISQGVGCNGIHPIYQRMARWLLLTHDRVATEKFPLSQEFLGTMLGVRRAGISEVASNLQKKGFIRYSRGIMEIVNRRGLEAASCECYEIIQREFDRLLGSPRKQGAQ